MELMIRGQDSGRIPGCYSSWSCVWRLVSVIDLCPAYFDQWELSVLSSYRRLIVCSQTFEE